MHPGFRLFCAFLVAAGVIYSPALNGPFISDDTFYVEGNPYVHNLSAESFFAMLAPTGGLPLLVKNYAPLHILLHSLEWQVFGSDVRGYHVVNVVLHALASCMLVALFRRTGIAAVPAFLGGAFFLVHPANVEAVAWISQLKTTSAMVLCLAALLAHPRRPIAAILFFALALLAKPPAAVALFAALAFGWAWIRPDQRTSDAAESRRTDRDPWRWGWLAGWAVVLALFSVAELAAFGQTVGQEPALYTDTAVRIRTIFATGLRYLAMATTSYGVSTFHEPPAAESLLDPLWLGSLTALALLTTRTVVTLRARRAEAAYWVWALVSFVPISGLIPIPFPLADRYLYFILPGLIGGVLLMLSGVLARVPHFARSVPALDAGRILTVLAILWIAVFAVRSYQRAFVWRLPESVLSDSARNYPEGRVGTFRSAREAAQQGNARTAVTLLESLHQRGYNRLDDLLKPGFERIQNDPDFVEIKREWAREWIDEITPLPDPLQPTLMVLAQAYIALGEFEVARETIYRAIYAGGPMTEYLYGALHQLETLEKSLSH